LKVAAGGAFGLAVSVYSIVLQNLQKPTASQQPLYNDQENLQQITKQITGQSVVF